MNEKIKLIRRIIAAKLTKQEVEAMIKKAKDLKRKS